MNPTTAHTQALKLQQQAARLEERLELLSNYGVERAEKLTTAALNRYIRRMNAAHKADSLRWEALS